MVRYVDTTTGNDFDNVVRFFLKHNITITHRDKLELVVAGEISEELLKQMEAETEFEETVTWGLEPLLGP